MVEEIREYQVKRFGELKDQLRMMKENPSYDPVHQWRISFKKMRAMHGLVEHLSEHHFNAREDLAPLKTIFSRAGKISDCQAQKPLLIRMVPLYPMQSRRLLQKLDRQLEIQGKALQKEMRQLSIKKVSKLEQQVLKRIDQNAVKLNVPLMWAFGSRQMMDAAHVLLTDGSDQAFHEVRILMKTSFYTFKRLEKKGIDLNQMDLKELDLCLVRIGEWHDWQMLYEQHEHRIVLRSLMLRIHYEARERKKTAEASLRIFLSKLYMLKK